MDLDVVAESKAGEAPRQHTDHDGKRKAQVEQAHQRHRDRREHMWLGEGRCIGHRDAPQQTHHAEVDDRYTDPVDHFVGRVLVANTVSIEPILHTACGHGLEVTFGDDVPMVLGVPCYDPSEA